MDLKVTDVILGPVVSEKAYKENNKHKNLVLRVHMLANKPMIAEALHKLFNAQAVDIRTYIRKGKNKKAGRRVYRSKDEKRAVIKLKEGESLSIMGNESMPGAVNESQD